LKYPADRSGWRPKNWKGMVSEKPGDGGFRVFAEAFRNY
jgi:hypothetical protein